MAGTTGSFGGSGSPDIELKVLCDGTQQFIRAYTRAIDGTVTFIDTELDGVTVYVPADAFDCDEDLLQVTLCDDTGIFYRRFVRNSIGDYTVTDFDLDGTTVHTIVGNIQVCGEVQSDIEALVLCDDNGSFFRHVMYNRTGTAATVRNTTLDGITNYTPVGTVRTCAGGHTIVAPGCILNTVTGQSRPVTLVYTLDDDGDVIAGPQTIGATGLTDPLGTNEVITVGSCEEIAKLELVQVCFSETGAPTVIRRGYKVVAITDRPTPPSATSLLERFYVEDVTGNVYDQTIVTEWRCLTETALVDIPASTTRLVSSMIPAGRTIVGISFTVVQGTANITNSISAPMAAVSNIPTGYSASWSTFDDREQLLPPVSITTAAASRVLVTLLYN